MTGDMRFIHTADWHLGRIFHGIHLTDDQAYVLDQLLDLVKDFKPDAILIAGDVYDRAVPPPEAVNLLDDVLTRLVIDIKAPVVLTAGNHDSPDRLAFASRLVQAQGLHVVGSLAETPTPITFETDSASVQLFALPYLEPPLVREKLKDASLTDHDSAMKAVTNRLRALAQPGSRSIVMAHAFTAGGEVSESERPLSIGGAGTVDMAAFAGFDYVALGHLHRPQQVGGDGIQYSGSLLKYSFSEATHQKSVNLVELDASGNASVERIPLVPRRDVRCIEGQLTDLLQDGESDPNREDYLMVTIHDKGAILDPIGKLREVYPNVLHIERPQLASALEVRGDARDHRKMQDLDLFSAFFTQVTSDELTGDESAAYVKAVDSLRQKDREARH